MEAVPRPGELTAPLARTAARRAGGPWQIEHVRGAGGEFHALIPTADRCIWRFDVTRPTLALGSSQSPAEADRRVAEALGMEVITRRSGGGAVVILPGEVVWIDVVIPAGDPLWEDDVGRAMSWVGEAWLAALSDFGIEGSVHRGALLASTWSRQVCFSGLGTGEVHDGHGRKLVGISQRRTRDWARFQTMAHLQWRPEVVAALVAPPRPTPSDLADAVASVPVPADDLAAAVIAAIQSADPPPVREPTSA